MQARARPPATPGGPGGRLDSITTPASAGKQQLVQRFGEEDTWEVELSSAKLGRGEQLVLDCRANADIKGLELFAHRRRKTGTLYCYCYYYHCYHYHYYLLLLLFMYVLSLSSLSLSLLLCYIIMVFLYYYTIIVTYI